MNIGTAPVHSVFGAALSVLLSDTAITAVTDLPSFGATLLAFCFILVMAYMAEFCFHKVKLRASPLPFVFVAFIMCLSLNYMKQGDILIQIPFIPADQYILSALPSLNSKVILISILMMTWCIFASLLGLSERGSEA